MQTETGKLAGRTRTLWAKFRPWILWKAIPFRINPEKFVFHRIEMNYVVKPGIFGIITVSSSGDTDLQMTELYIEC